MPETTVHLAPDAATDQEFLRRAGIAPDLQPGTSRGLKALLVLALLLAGATTAFAGMFASGAPATSPAYQACTTSCPMVGK